MKIRQQAHRELDRANNNLEWVLQHLKNLDELGYGQREDFLQPIAMIVTAVGLLQQSITKLKDSI